MRPIAALPLLALAGLGVWLLLRGGPASVTPFDDSPPSVPAPAPPPSAISVGMGTELASAPIRPAPRRDQATGAVEVRTGAVIVTLVPPAGIAVPKGVSFDAQPAEFNHAQKPLPLEQEDGTWRYDALPAGRWRIFAFVPGFVDASRNVDVRPEGEASISLPLELGGAASWKVALTTREVPELVRVSLLDGRGVPIEGTYQTAGTTLHAVPASVPALPAEGRVVGLKTGRYRLRASTVDGDPKEQSFEIKPGETVALEFTLAR